MDKSTERFDVLIIGASVSGCTAAYILGKAGYRVLLMDPVPFPRRKACGEGLGLPGRRYLQSLGLWSDALQDSAYPLSGYSIHPGNGERIEMCGELDTSGPEVLGISRELLDAHIRQQAVSLPSVQFLAESAVQASRSEGYWSIEASNGSELQARELVVAAGGQQKIFSDVELLSADKKRHGAALWAEGKWGGELPETVHIYHYPEGQIILTPLSSTRVNVSMLLNRNNRQSVSAKHIQSRAKEVLQRAGFVTSSLTDCKGAAAIHCSRVLNAENSGAYFIGDAVERFDPVGGMGMTHAIYSAALASEALLFDSSSDGKRLSLYYRKRVRGARILRLMTSLSASLNVSHNKLAQRFVFRYPGLALALLSYIRNLFPEPPVFLVRDSDLSFPEWSLRWSLPGKLQTKEFLESAQL